MTTSIIVYRNPAEAALWESGVASVMSIGFLAAIFVGFITYGVLCFLVPRLGSRLTRWHQKAIIEHGTLWVSIAAFLIALAFFVTE